MKIDGGERERWVALLLGVSFFEEFDGEEAGELLDAGEIKKRDFHEYIIREGEKDSSFFVILKGKVKIIKQAYYKKKKELWTLDAGDCFGEVGFLLGDKRTASVLSADESYIFRIKREDAAALPLSAREKLYRRIGASLAGKLRSTTDLAVSPYFI